MQMVVHRRPHWEVALPGQVGFAVTLELMALTVPSPRKPSQHHRPQCMAGHNATPGQDPEKAASSSLHALLGISVSGGAGRPFENIERPGVQS